MLTPHFAAITSALPNSLYYWYEPVGRDSLVCITTRYDAWIESRLRARFSAPVHTGPGAHPASCTMGNGSFPGVKRPERGAIHPPTSKCRGHERVGLYLYSPSGPSWPVIGRTFTFTLPIFSPFLQSHARAAPKIMTRHASHMLCKLLFNN